MEDPVNNIINPIVATGELGRYVAAALIVLVTMVVAHLCTKALRRLLNHESSLLPANSIFINIVRVIIWICGLSIMFSSCFGYDLTAAIAALGVGGLALSLGCQDTVANLIGGLQISLAHTVEPGNGVEVSGYRGMVQDVTWRYTTIVTAAGEQVIVPNSVINSSTVVKLPPVSTVRIALCVANTVRDLDAVTAQIVDAVRKNVPCLVEGEDNPRVVYTEVSDFAYSGTLIVQVEEGTDVAATKTAAIKAIAPFVA